jgi:hypothetical protein
MVFADRPNWTWRCVLDRHCRWPACSCPEGAAVGWEDHDRANRPRAGAAERLDRLKGAAAYVTRSVAQEPQATPPGPGVGVDNSEIARLTHVIVKLSQGLDTAALLGLCAVLVSARLSQEHSREMALAMMAQFRHTLAEAYAVWEQVAEQTPDVS